MGRGKPTPEGDWSSQGCGLTWRRSAGEVARHYAVLRANGIARAQAGPYHGQTAEVGGETYAISGSAQVTLSYWCDAPRRDENLGTYGSPAEARLAAAAFHFGDPGADPAELLAAYGYAREPERGEPRLAVFSKSDGATEASVTLRTEEPRPGRTPSTSVIATVGGLRAKRWSNTLVSRIRHEDDPEAKWTPAQLLSLAVRAAAAVNDARLAKPARSRRNPLEDGEETARIGALLQCRPD